MNKTKLFLTVRTLKEERRTAPPERQDEIDEEVKRLEPGLTHEEAVSIVQQYEQSVAPGCTVAQSVGVPLSPSVEVAEWNTPDLRQQGTPRLWEEVAWGMKR